MGRVAEVPVDPVWLWVSWEAGPQMRSGRNGRELDGSPWENSFLAATGLCLLGMARAQEYWRWGAKIPLIKTRTKL